RHAILVSDWSSDVCSSDLALPALAGSRLPSRYLRRLGRYRLGPGVFKLDYALAGPVPWRDEQCRQAGTLHLGGRVDDFAGDLEAIARGGAPTRPLVIAAQPAVVDPTPAPEGRHTLWASAPLPHPWPRDPTPAIA